MLDHEAEAVAARTREAPVTAGAGVRNLFLGHHHLWMKGMRIYIDGKCAFVKL